MSTKLNLQHLDHVAIGVSDIQRSTDWYQDILGLERRYPQWDEPVMLCAGETCVALFSAGRNPSPPPGDNALAMRHFAFLVDRAGFETAQAQFRAAGMPVQFADHGPVHSIYISDPDGHRIELTTPAPVDEKGAHI
jgi:catechol 2,3-dioxygenase-like lactoylglutathione lyase family enzyme